MSLFTGPDDPALSRLRIVAQRLAGTELVSATDVVGWLGCLQAQHLPGALRSVSLRQAAGAPDDIADALESGTVVRSWPMRGTLHLTLAADLGWLCDLTRDAIFRKAATRHAELGIDRAMIERAGDLLAAALAEQGRLSRAEVMQVWAPHGLTDVPQRGYHLLSGLAMEGMICQGPLTRRADGTRSESEQDFVASADWIRRPRRLERPEALATWLRTYALSHGPVTVKDAQRWTGLGAKDVRQGFADAGDALATDVVAGTTYYRDPHLPELATRHRKTAGSTLLLPGFDELVLGYADRTCTVPAEHAQAVVPGGNGVFTPTVVDGGRAIGTWRFGTDPPQVTAFTDFTAAERAALGRLGSVIG